MHVVSNIQHEFSDTTHTIHTRKWDRMINTYENWDAPKWIWR